MPAIASEEAQPHRWRRLTAAMVLVVLLPAAIAFADPEQASAACEADFCTSVKTDADGVYTLVIPGQQLRLLYPPLAGCTWQVKAEFGDGSPNGAYVFSEAQGISEEHTYPAPGVYTFHAYATKGVHDGTSDPCPDLHIEATVTYPEPPPQEEPEEPEPEGPGAEAPPGGGPAPAAPSPLASEMPPPAKASPSWKACGNGVRALRVSCSKARKVLKAARHLLSRARLKQGATFEAAGFDCRLRGNGTIACRHGRQRVLGT